MVAILNTAATVITFDSSLFLLYVLFSNMSKFSLPIMDRVENNGFEPMTPCLQSKCSTS